jgi:homoserine dehydrogenase
MSLAEQVRVGGEELERDSRRAEICVGLLGLGKVGSAVARLAAETSPRAPIRIGCALVRDPRSRRRPDAIPLTTCGKTLVDAQPDVLVELLGGLEPARSLVLRAIERGIPVVTANKSLLAHHGDEILAAAAAAGVPLCYEASVIAGVPFLDTFARRPLASRITAITAIVNGTTNYILTELARGANEYRGALAEALRLGFAEPDPSNDVDGSDAAEKLVVLLRQFAARSVDLADIETAGITDVTGADLRHAAELGGTVKPIVQADWATGALSAFAGPAFVPLTHPLAALTGVTNGICLRDCDGHTLGFTGPGAGPRATAVTVLDDVRQAVEGRAAPPVVPRRGWFEPPETPWLLRLTSEVRVPDGREIGDLLGSYGVWIARTSSKDTTSGEAQSFLTHPVHRPRIEAAARALSLAARCSASFIRAIEARA